MRIKEWLKENWVIILISITITSLTIIISLSLSNGVEYIKVHGLQSLWYGTGK